MKKIFLPALTIIGASALLTSCDKDDTEAILPYTVPTSYNFTTADFGDVTASVNMMQGFTTYLGKGTSRKLSQDTVNYLWDNINGAFTAEMIASLPYTPAQLNTKTALKLSALTVDPSTIKIIADSMVKISALYNTPGGIGIAGKQGTRLFNATGYEFNQGVAKGLMGGFQMANIFLHLDNSRTADNKTATATGTAMQHEWDLAFGYASLPVNFNSDTAYTYPGTDINRPLGVGGYFRERGKYILAGKNVYEAFIKGRAAISGNDYAVRDAAIATIKEYVEKTLAAGLYEYAGIARDGSADVPSKAHNLSEGFGFSVALKYRPANSKLTAAAFNELKSLFSTNFYDLIAEAKGDNNKLTKIRKIITTAYGNIGSYKD